MIITNSIAAKVGPTPVLAIASKRSDFDQFLCYGDVTVSLTISGGSGLIKKGVGKLTLTGLNTFTGGTILSNGILSLGSSESTGRLTATTSITNNSNLTINRSNAFTQATDLGLGVDIRGTGSFTQAGAGTTTLTAANTYTGITTIKNGKLVLDGAANRLAVTGAVVLGDTSTAGKLVLGGTTTASQTLTALTTTGSGGAVVGGNATNSTLTLNIASSNTFAGTLGGAGTNENNLALTKSGVGTLTLSNTANSFNGQLLVDAGTVQVSKLENTGTASSIGAGAASIRLGATATATLEYNGTTDSSSNRKLQVGNNAANAFGATILNNSVSGKLTFTGANFSAPANSAATTARVLTLGGSYTGAANEIQGAISDNTAAAVSLIKTGASTWKLSGANTYTGGTQIDEGSLIVSKTSGSVTATATFLVSGASTALSVSFSAEPVVGTTFRFFNGVSMQSYPNVSLTGQTYRVGSFNSSNSTLTIAESSAVTTVYNTNNSTVLYELTSIPADWQRSNIDINRVDFGNVVTSIGNYALNTCTNLASVSMLNSVTTIGAYAFSSCTSLTSVTIPDSVATIGDSAFSGCSGLTSVTIGNSVTNIGAFAFGGCTKLVNLTIGSSVTSIRNEAFQGCYGLTSVVIPNSVTTIGGSAFSGCSGLTSLSIGSGVTSIGDGAFKSCTKLTSLTIPNSVTTIGNDAFYACTGLTSLFISSAVTSIGTSVFNLCTKLTAITVDADNPNYSNNNEDGVLFNKNQSAPIQTTLIQYPAGRAGVYTIPDSITSIGGVSFLKCVNLTGLVVNAANTAFSSLNGVLFNKLQTTLIQYPAGKADTSYTIPSTITTIGTIAFSHNVKLNNITIPNSVTSIGNYAFSDCTALQVINCYVIYDVMNVLNVVNGTSNITIKVRQNDTSWNGITTLGGTTTTNGRPVNVVKSL